MKRYLIRLAMVGGLILAACFGQTKRDARAVGLAGSYGTVADGIFAVGYNPALLALQQDKPFMLQLVGLDYGLVSNYISLANLNALSGDTLSTDEKDLILNNLDKSGGLRIFTDLHLPLPLLNYASGNMALTSNTIIVGDLIIPTGILSLLLNGNPVGEDLDMTLKFDLLGVTEYGFSFAIPSDDFAWGMTIKYLQGLFYFGLDPEFSNATLVTDTTALYGSGTYYFRQGIGGSGLGLDLGFVTQEIAGWRIGVSMINALGTISWNKPSLIKDLMSGGDNIYGTRDDLFHIVWAGTALNDSMAVSYEYTIDTLNAQTMSQGDIFYSNPPDEQVVYDLTEDGKLRQFTTRYPALFRFSVSKRFPDLLVVSDLVAGFEDRFFARDRWRWSIGTEILRNPTVPIRFGFSWAGGDFKRLGMGIGIHKGPVIFDFGLAFKNGVWIHTMKGLDLSLGVTLTSFRGRKDKTPEPAEEPVVPPQ
ncbi:MAG: DUF5723 family protein [Candidatus Neomarinimicrobiota bacterium]